MIETLQHYINGQRVDGASGRFSDVFNPALGAVTARVPLADRDEVIRAVAAAKAVFPEWAAQTPLRRARVMSKFKNLVEAHATELAAIITSQHGKVHNDAVGEVTRGLEVVESPAVARTSSRAKSLRTSALMSTATRFASRFTS